MFLLDQQCKYNVCIIPCITISLTRAFKKNPLQKCTILVFSCTKLPNVPAIYKNFWQTLKTSIVNKKKIAQQMHNKPYRATLASETKTTLYIFYTSLFQVKTDHTRRLPCIILT